MRGTFETFEPRVAGHKGSEEKETKKCVVNRNFRVDHSESCVDNNCLAAVSCVFLSPVRFLAFDTLFDVSVSLRFEERKRMLINSVSFRITRIRVLFD